MTAQDDPYVRVYYRILDDPKFATVYDDDRALACWLRLLIHADALYPAPATLPHGTRKASLAILVKAGLVDVIAGARYRIHGLTAEREARAEASRFAADVKHHGLAEAQRRQSERNAAAVRPQSEGNADAVPLLAEPLHSKPLLSTPSHSDAPARKNGSNDPETDQERLARYRALRDDESKPSFIREAAKTEVERMERLIA